MGRTFYDMEYNVKMQKAESVQFRFIQTLQQEGPFAASTDIGALFANPEHVFGFYAKLAQDIGLTLQPLLEVANFLIARTPKRQDRIAGFHSKIGFVSPRHDSMLNAAKSRVLDSVLHSVAESSSKAVHIARNGGSSRQVYVNTHAPHIPLIPDWDLERIKQMQQASPGKPPFLIAVENDVHPDWERHVREACERLTEHGIVWIRLLDLCHIVGTERNQQEHNGKTPQETYRLFWTAMLHLIEKYINEPLLIHAPFGTLLSDSLDTRYIDEHMYRDVFALLRQTLYFLVIENQRASNNIIRFNPMKNENEYNRLLKIFDQLLKAGAFPQEGSVHV